MTETYRKIVTIQASAGTKGTLITLEGWELNDDGTFTVTDPDWRNDVLLSGDATILDVADPDDNR